MYSVYLLIIPPDGERLEDLDDVLADAPFKTSVERRIDGNFGVWCHGIKPSGAAALPEALRLAQVGLSVPLKHHYPAYAARGGLLWSDIMTAEILTAP